MSDRVLRNLGLYIHLPYCIHRCVYCDFNVQKLKHRSQISDYLGMLHKEVESWAKKVSEDTEVDSIFLGGGTPSLLNVDQMEALLDGVKENFSVTDDVEITMEANPSSVLLSALKGFRGMGINRLSLGIQSFQPKHLKTLERIHSRKQALEGIAAAKEAGFKHLNLDFIFGIPDQNLDDLKMDIEKVLSLNPSHLSTYQLQVPNKNPLSPHLPEDGLTADMYEWIIDKLKSRGYEHYEVSAFGKPDSKSRHNLKYWRLEDFLGLGAGAYSRLTSDAFPWGLHIKNIDDLEAYGSKVATTGFGVAEKEVLPQSTAEKDYLVTRLRLLEGLSGAEFEGKFQKNLMISYGKKIKRLRELGLLDSSQKMLKLTSKGLLYLNAVLVEFM